MPEDPLSRREGLGDRGFDESSSRPVGPEEQHRGFWTMRDGDITTYQLDRRRGDELGFQQDPEGCDGIGTNATDTVHNDTAVRKDSINTRREQGESTCGNDPETPGQDSRESSTSQPNGTTSSRRGWSDTVSATVKKVTQWAGLGLCGPGRRSTSSISRTTAATTSDQIDDRRFRIGRQSGGLPDVGSQNVDGNDTTGQSRLTSDSSRWEL